MQYTHPKSGSLFRSSGAVSESFDLVRRGEIKCLVVFYSELDNKISLIVKRENSKNKAVPIVSLGLQKKANL